MPVDPQYLRNFVPLNELTVDNLRELSSKTSIESLVKGKAVFKSGDTDRTSVYITSGEVMLLSEGGGSTSVVGGTPPSRFPIDHHIPRQNTAIAKSDIQFMRVNNDLLDMLLTWDQSNGYVVTDPSEADESDWMSSMLQSKIFRQIPPSNIQAIFMRMENITFKKGDIVIQQGAEGDYYYFIKGGRCVVNYQGKSGKVIKLAELEAGTGFGEDALISNNRRNATVAMLTDGSMMRLAKSDFEELLKVPILTAIDFNAAKKMIQEDNALLLDVRLESEYNHSKLKGSINLPLYMLRIKIGQLDRARKYIVICDTGRRSSSASFILNEKGFESYYIEGGLMHIKESMRAANGS